jgi:hypothetical protein
VVNADISSAVTKYGGNIAYRFPSPSTQMFPGGRARAASNGNTVTSSSMPF